MEYQQVPDAAMVVALMRMMESMMIEMGILNTNDSEQQHMSQSGINQLSNSQNSTNNKQSQQHHGDVDDFSRIDMIFLFCLAWTIGSTIDEPSRKLFDNFFKKMVKDPIRC